MRVTFPDPLKATAEILRAEFPAYEATAGVSVGTVQVEEANSQGVRLPYLMVALDDAETRYPVLETALLRLVVWAPEDWRALRIGQHARAILRDSRTAEVRSYGDPGSPPLPTEDPETGQPMTFQTITARLRAVPL